MSREEIQCIEKMITFLTDIREMVQQNQLSLTNAQIEQILCTKIAWKKVKEGFFYSWTLLLVYSMQYQEMAAMQDEYSIAIFANRHCGESGILCEFKDALNCIVQETLRLPRDMSKRNSLACMFGYVQTGLWLSKSATEGPEIDDETRTNMQQSMINLLPSMNQSDTFMKVLEEFQHLTKATIGSFDFSAAYKFGNASRHAGVDNKITMQFNHQDAVSQDPKVSIPHLFDKMDKTSTILAIFCNVVSQTCVDGHPLVGSGFFVLPYQLCDYKMMNRNNKKRMPIVLFFQGHMFVESDEMITHFNDAISLVRYWFQLVDRRYKRQVGRMMIDIESALKMIGISDLLQ